MVARGDGVDGVLARPVIAQLRRRQLRMDGYRRPRQRGRAQRGQGGAPVPVPQPVGVAGERLRVGQQLVPEHDRLGGLQMGEAGCRRTDVRAGLCHQRVLQLGQGQHQLPGVIAQVEPQVVGRLVVARAAGAQLAADLAQPLDQHPFQERVHVLVGVVRADAPGADVLVQRVDRRQQPLRLFLVEDLGSEQLADVGARARQVVRGHAEVAVGRPGEGEQGRVGRRAEASTPELIGQRGCLPVNEVFRHSGLRCHGCQ